MRHRAPHLDAETATAVADVVETAAELRRASAAHVALERDLPEPGRRSLAEAAKASRAEGYVKELTDRIFSRARSAGLDGADLLRLANLALDGKLTLPAGAGWQEAA